MKNKLSEADLKGRISEGDRIAFAQLYGTYLTNVSCYVNAFCCCNETAELIIQDVFFAIWEGRHRLRDVKSIKQHVFENATQLLKENIQKGRVSNAAMINNNVLFESQ